MEIFFELKLPCFRNKLCHDSVYSIINITSVLNIFYRFLYIYLFIYQEEDIPSIRLPEKEMLNPSYDIEKSDIKRNWALKFP